MSKNLIFGIGAVVGIVLLVLAALAFHTSFQWSRIDREGATIGWAIVGFFLTIAGAGSIAGSANHAFRVVGRPMEHH